MASWSALMPSNGMGSLKLPTVNGKARESRSERSCRSRSSSEDGASCHARSAISRTTLHSAKSAASNATVASGSAKNKKKKVAPGPGSNAAPKKKGPKVIKLPKLPIHLAKKVKDPAYDPQADTSLTDNEIALMERWAAAWAKKLNMPAPKKKKKPPTGVAEDLSHYYASTTDKEGLECDAVGDDIGKHLLLYPRGSIPMGVDNFVVCHSPALMDGWVNQTSPACAAASTASAWNALLGLRRSDPKAMGQDNVVSIMRKILEDDIYAKQQEVCAMFGEAELGKFLDLFKKSMIEDGQEPFAFLPKTITGDIISRIHKVCDDTPAATGPAGLTLMKKFVAHEQSKLVGRKKRGRVASKKRKKKGGTGTGASDGAEDPETQQDVLDSERLEQGEDGDDAGGGSGGINLGTPYGSLMALLRQYGGLQKICAKRPSTSFFGNDGIIKAVKRLKEDNPGKEIFTKPFMAKLKPGDKEKYFKLTSKDTSDAIAKHWKGMRDTFMSFDSVLLFHQVNHYSMIYALREWVDLSGTRQRQVLTAKRGQRPTAWLNFTEVRRILLSWGGYRIIEIKRMRPDTFNADLRCGAVLECHKGPARVSTPAEAQVKWGNAYKRFLPSGATKET